MVSAEENSWTQERRDFCCTHFRRACKAQVREVPKWVVHDVNIPVDVPVKKEVPVPETVVKTVKAGMREDFFGISRFSDWEASPC